MLSSFAGSQPKPQATAQPATAPAAVNGATTSAGSPCRSARSSIERDVEACVLRCISGPDRSPLRRGGELLSGLRVITTLCQSTRKRRVGISANDRPQPCPTGDPTGHGFGGSEIRRHRRRRSPPRSPREYYSRTSRREINRRGTRRRMMSHPAITSSEWRPVTSIGSMKVIGGRWLEGRPFDHRTDPSQNRGTVTRQIKTEHLDPAPSGFEQPQQHPDGSRLSGSVGAK